MATKSPFLTDIQQQMRMKGHLKTTMKGVLMSKEPKNVIVLISEYG
ncbi:hypothetical protein [Shewanella sp. TC10]|nr:hypothetical protein [Shewanella sp. TC10]